MTAKEFVLSRFPNACVNRIEWHSMTYYAVRDGRIKKIATAKTESAAWSLAKKLIIENEKLKKHETKTT